MPIKQLKKYVAGIEANFRDFTNAKERVRHSAPKGKSVAVVGAGPAGLSAAYDLVREGYQVEVFEKETAAGGLIKYVIPDFRMDKTGFDFEVGQLEELGVVFHFKKELGKDIRLEQIRRDFDSVILSLGMGKVKPLPVVADNIPANRWSDGLAFLKKYNNKSLPIAGGSRILVIGGGNSAMDAARAAKHHHASNEVFISCIESLETMPAFEEEVKHARDEGIVIMPSSYAHQCLENSTITVVLHDYLSRSLLKTLEVDYIVVAIDQVGETGDYAEVGAENLSEKGRIIADEHNGLSNLGNVFVAGDICAGNHMSLIGAIASGKRAALGVRQQLEGYNFPYEGLNALLGLNGKRKEQHASLPFNANGGLTEFLSKFNLFQSCEKCNHCIDNLGCPAMIKFDGKIVIDQAKCTKCGLCIDVCPNDAISWAENGKLESVF